MTFLLPLLGVYAAVTVLAYAAQRRAIFPAPTGTPAPGFEGATLEQVPGPGGSIVHALHLPGPEDAPTLVHFHGNGEDLAHVEALAREVRAAGLGFYAVEYPGYGLSRAYPPSEEALLAAADAALRHLHDALGVSYKRVVLQGQSLGTGVATEMALRGHGARLVLIAPYTSMTDMAAKLAPFLPARLLIRDRFDTRSRAPRVAVPVLIIHGSEDELIPVEMARTLAGLFPEARLEIIAGAHHNDLFGSREPRVVAMVAGFARGGR
jgi:uncharacterized protein